MENEKTKKAKGTTIKDLEKMLGDVVGVVGELSKKIDNMAPKTDWIKPQVEVVPEEEEEGVQTTVVPPKWRKIVDEVLGTDFGLSVEYPDSGRGFSFTIMVPKSKSNAPDAHWDFYRCDKRTKAIGNAEGTEGVKKYCELVKKNLTRPKP